MPQTTYGGEVNIGDALTSNSIRRAGYELEVLDWDLSSPPESPSVGDLYIVAEGATGPWYTWDNDFATYVGGGSWRRSQLSIGQHAFITTRGLWRAWDGKHWAQSDHLGVARDGLVASATQEQGQVPLGHELCRFTLVANANDACTLPPVATGVRLLIANDGGDVLQVFPALGNMIDNGSANASVTIGNAKRRAFYGFSKSLWVSILGDIEPPV